MKQPKRILFIQHAAGLGGSAISLLYTARALNPSRYEPIVALIRPSVELISLYENAEITTIPWPGILTFEHTTAKHYSPLNPNDWVAGTRVLLSRRQTAGRLRELIAMTRPDLIHLNSVVLATCAQALASSEIPLVWHIREHPVEGLMGFRKRWIHSGLSHWADELIFISEADRAAWGMSSRGVVIRNFVDMSEFDRNKNGDELRVHLGIPYDSSVLLYAGGPLKIKGILTLLDALAGLKSMHPNLICLMPGSSIRQAESIARSIARSLLMSAGFRTISMKIECRLKNGLNDTCMILPFQVKMAEFIAASDIVLFPSIQPHFARPVVEAAAMAKPVIASRLDGINELVEEGKSGLLVKPGDPDDLSHAISLLLQDKPLRNRMGELGYRKACREFSSEAAMKSIEGIYENLLGM